MARTSAKRKRVVMAINENRNQEDHNESMVMAVNKWLDLPSCLFEIIFANLNPIDALLIIPLVCKDWGRIILEILFVKEKNYLDFRVLLDKRFNRFFHFLEDEESRAKKLMKLLVGLMHALVSDSQSDDDTRVVKTTSITDISFIDGLPFYDRHLVYIAERCPQVKWLFLPCGENLTGKGISRALRFWRGLETIYFAATKNIPGSSDLYLPRIIQEFGIHCKNLDSLQLGCFDLHWDLAAIIVRNVQSLRLLCLVGVNVSKYGLQIFLSRCKKLRRLHLEHCVFMNNEGIDYPKRIQILRIQEGRRCKWMTDLVPGRMLDVHTTKELVKLLWERQK